MNHRHLVALLPITAQVNAADGVLRADWVKIPEPRKENNAPFYKSAHLFSHSAPVFQRTYTHSRFRNLKHIYKIAFSQLLVDNLK